MNCRSKVLVLSLKGPEFLVRNDIGFWQLTEKIADINALAFPRIHDVLFLKLEVFLVCLQSCSPSGGCALTCIRHSQ